MCIVEEANLRSSLEASGSEGGADSSQDTRLVLDEGVEGVLDERLIIGRRGVVQNVGHGFLGAPLSGAS